MVIGLSKLRLNVGVWPKTTLLRLRSMLNNEFISLLFVNVRVLGFCEITIDLGVTPRCIIDVKVVDEWDTQ